MPKNIKGGNKAKKGKNSSLREFSRKLELPDDSGYQFYGLVLKHYGATTDILYLDNRNNIKGEKHNLKKVIGYVRGSIKKRCRLKTNDIIIIAIREYQDNKVDIIHKYNEDEMKSLLRNNYLDADFINVIKANAVGIDIKKNDINISNIKDDMIEFNDSIDLEFEEEEL
jgi:translation initiation factor 1A|tara:strand:+ start:3687 stop:4193 length:507 start_codon:yes stop_codon:yes gene_type:complete